MSRYLDRLRTDPRVQHIDDERRIGNGILVTLRDGWFFNDPGTHVFGEETESAVRRSMSSVRAEPRT